jgi:hypothetical protein
MADKIARVRKKAVDWICRRRMKQLVPELETAFENEKSAKDKKTIEFYLRLLRDGYILKEEADGGYWVTAHSKDGGTTSRYVSKSDFELLGIEAIVFEMAEK